MAVAKLLSSDPGRYEDAAVEAVRRLSGDAEGPWPTLDVRIDASIEGQLEGLKGAVARHLDRFAFREAPLTFDWQAA